MMIVAGGILVVVSVLGVVLGWGDGGSPTVAAADSPAEETTTTAPPSTTARPSTTSESPTTSTTSTTTSTTSTSTTTSTTSTSTTSTTTTTTTISSEDALAAFIQQFALDIANGDTEALMATLNPAVILGSGEQLCRDFVEREILALGDYQLIGDVNGPSSKSVDTVAGTITVDNIYEAQVSFVFGGQSFDSRADFVRDDDGQISWLATCR